MICDLVGVFRDGYDLFMTDLLMPVRERDEHITMKDKG